jgi:hypothetical protein
VSMNPESPDNKNAVPTTVVTQLTKGQNIVGIGDTTAQALGLTQEEQEKILNGGFTNEQLLRIRESKGAVPLMLSPTGKAR